MSDERREKREAQAPFARSRADERADMTTTPRGPRFGLEDLNDPGRSLEALAHWDELEPELLSALEAHPRHGPRLATLRDAERWLLEQAPARTSHRAFGACPSSEDLYDFGRGPGYAQLDPHRRLRIEEHVQACEACQELVTTLSAPPPLPLDISPLEQLPAPERLFSERSPAIPSVHVQPARQAAQGDLPGHLSTAPRGRVLRGSWLRFAAAASVLIVGGVLVFEALRSKAPLGPTQDPLLRGRSAEALIQPRGRVLGADSAARELWPALGSAFTFEVAPVRDAEVYTVELWRAGADPFERGEKLARGESAEPIVTLAAALVPGRYTWEAWVRVNGIESQLGTRDFEVAADPAIDEQLRALDGVVDPTQKLERALQLLDRAGYRADARNLARTLPAGALRDLWLAPVPAR